MSINELRRTRLLPATLTLLWAGLCPSAPLQAQVPLGSEFQVNTRTNVWQERPDVGRSSNGDFVVVWTDTFTGQLFGQRFAASGNKLGNEFRINSGSGSLGPRAPAVAMGADGSFVVVFFQRNGPNLEADIFARRFDESGNPLGVEFQVNSYTTGTQSFTDVAMDADGNFVVVWQSDPHRAGATLEVFGQRFDDEGNPLGGEFQVNTFTTGIKHSPAVASDPDGNFAVAWQSSAHGIAVDHVRARRYDAAGNALGGEFHVASAAKYPAIASDDNGNLLVVWDKLRLDVEDAPSDVAGRFFDASGNPAGEEFLVNTYTSGLQRGADASSDSDGNFVVVWETRDQDGHSWGVFGRQFASDGTPLTNEFQINTYTTNGQDRAAVASDPSGDFVVVWESYDQDGHSWGIFGQRFAGPGLALTVDGSCPGPATVEVSGAPPNSEVTLIAAANTNGFTKGGTLCNGTRFDIGEPFQLPPRFVIVDGNGNGSASLTLAPDRCHLQALALASCETSNVVVVP